MEYKTSLFCEFDKYAAASYCAVHGTDPALNIGDITKANEKEVPDFNVMFGGSPCFPAGTQVLARNGYRSIETLRPGDLVLTHQNRFMPVVRIGGRHGQEIYKLKAYGTLPIYATGNHPFFVVTRKVFYHHDGKSYGFSVPYRKELKDIVPGEDYLCSILLHSNNGLCEQDDLLFRLDRYTDDDVLWMLGRYVADGCYDKNRVKIAVGIGKEPEFEAVLNRLGWRRKTLAGETNSTYYYISDKTFNDLVRELNLGTCALNKRIPTEILLLPVDALRHFFDGYMSGDGCYIEKIKKYQATTVSYELALNLQIAVQKLYRTGCQIYFDKRPDTTVIQGRTVHQHNTYMIRFRKDAPKQKQWYCRGEYLLYPVRSVEETGCFEDVYNIEVEEDHSYVVNNVCVKNCQDFSVAGKMNGAVWTCKTCGHAYNPLEADYKKRDRCPVCGSAEIEKTRSSLLAEWLRFLREKKPRFAIYENVKNITGSRFRATFDLFVKELEDYGYNVYWKVLNAKHYGIPQNRERVYCVIIRKDLDNGKFKFPAPVPLRRSLSSMLDDHVDEKYYISDEKVSDLTAPPHGESLKQSVPEGMAPQTATHGILCGVNLSEKASHFCGFTDTANTLLARDYKGFGNQQQTRVMEFGCERSSQL